MNICANVDQDQFEITRVIIDTASHDRIMLSLHRQTQQV